MAEEVKLGRAKVLINLLRDKPHERGAEIGVQEGDTSFQLLEALPELDTLYCIDAWQWYSDYEHDRCLTDKTGGRWPDQGALDDAFRTFWRRMQEKQLESRMVVLPMFEADAAGYIKDASLDWCFLDANHSYEYTRDAIRRWLPKVRPGGLLAGHDYRNPHNPAWGVTRAVDEIFPYVESGSDFTWWVWKYGT